MNDSRNNTIDAAKGLGILFVVFSHINYAQPGLTIIYSFHIPLFFFLSGMVFKPQKYPSLKDLFRRKMQTMICPYVLFCLLGAVKCLLGSVANAALLGEKAGLLLLLKEVVISVIWAPYSQKYFDSFNTPMWFIPCLLMVETIYYLLVRHEENEKYFLPISVFLISLSGWIMEADIIPFDFSLLPWNFSSACFSLGFFALGNAFPKLWEKFEGSSRFRQSGMVRFSCLLLAFAITVPVALWNGEVSIGSRVLHNGLLFYITGIAGTAGILTAAYILQNSKLLRCCGQNSFTIMGSHFIIFGIVENVFFIMSCFGIAINPDNRKFIPGTAYFLIVASLTLLFVRFYNSMKNKLISCKN